MRCVVALLIVLVAAAPADGDTPGRDPWPQVERLLDDGAFEAAKALAEKRDGPDAEALVAYVAAREAGTAKETVTDAQVHLKQGDAARDKGDMAAAGRAYGAAAGVAERIGWLGAACHAYTNAGISNYYLARWELARASTERAIDIARTIGDRATEARALSHLGNYHESVGEYEVSLEKYGESLAIYEALGNESGQALVLSNMSVTYITLGELDEALAVLEKALPISIRLNDVEGIAHTRFNLGTVQEKLGRFDKSVPYLEAALEGFRDAGNERGVAAAQRQLAVATRMLEDYDRTRELLEASLAYHVKVGDKDGEAKVLGEISNLYADLGDLEGSIEYDRRALKALEGGDPVSIARVRMNIGASYAELLRHDQAMDEFDAALAVGLKLGAPELVARTWWNIASVHTLEGDYDKALAAVESAMKDVDGLSAGLADTESVAAREQWLGLFRVGLKAAVLKNDPAEAFGLVERLRARVLLGSLGGRTALRDAAVPPELREEEAAAFAAVVAAQQALTEARRSEKRKAVRRARKAVDAAHARSVAIIERIQRVATAASDVMFPEVDTLTALQERLASDETYVAYTGYAGGISLALVATKDDAWFAELGKTKDIVAAVEALDVSADVDVDEALARLRRFAVDPLRLDEKTKRLIVSSWGPLSYVPLTLLVDGRQIVYVPSATTYGVLDARRTKAGEKVLALGAPDYSRSRLAPIPASGVEAKAVGDVVLVGKDASETELEKAVGAEPRWRAIHLACHGQVDESNPTRSALALTPDEQSDGHLTTLEVARGAFPADLVVLSACETGKGTVYSGEGIMGLTRAFMVAGAPRILCSLWPVDDKATQTLMKKFYELWRAGDVTAAAALEGARAHVRGQEGWEHPYYWAAWVLWGLP